MFLVTQTELRYFISREDGDTSDRCFRHNLRLLRNQTYDTLESRVIFSEASKIRRIFGKTDLN